MVDSIGYISQRFDFWIAPSFLSYIRLWPSLLQIAWYIKGLYVRLTCFLWNNWAVTSDFQQCGILT